MVLSLISDPAAAAEEASDAQIADVAPKVMAAPVEEGGAAVDAAPAAALFSANPQNAFNVSTVADATSNGVTLQVRRGLISKSASEDVPLAWGRVTGGANGHYLNFFVYDRSGSRVAAVERPVHRTTYTWGFEIRSGYRYLACLSDERWECDWVVYEDM
ncbi:hypothetical protein [Nocardiopsis suaedae]|uniref:Uncharacterized protein n=1 Tax=Nocardiopsis suaedae TaxID=3018444 RepID=A0ABT4TVM8_9ACTN|nr:hypothetical protein [Nocardiopsis suaedae]MDA2808740.1 hypothetical protein [Nocardiopsis suaedae]